MKHVKKISVPALAITMEGHPDIKTSIQGFLADPVAALMLHINKDAE